MSADVVLYDLPGPKARRRALVGTVVVLAAAAALVFVAARRLHERGQFASELWTPIFNPADENFVNVWTLLGKGAIATLSAAALAIAFSLIIGTALGSARMLVGAVPRYGKYLRVPLVVYIELFRGLPVVVAIFFAWQVFPRSGLRLDFLPGNELMWYVVVGLTVYNSVIIAEILRAGVASLPSGQLESARAVGMTETQAMRLVLLPQAFRTMLPALISQLVVVLKDTSLGYFIGYLELLRRGIRISQVLDNPIQVLFLIALLYIGVNYALSRLAVWTEKRMSRAAGGAKAAQKTEAAAGAAAGG